jgi:hypothetical protein
MRALCLARNFGGYPSMISVVTRKTNRSDRSRWIATTIKGAAVATLAAAIGLSLGTVAF